MDTISGLKAREPEWKAGRPAMEREDTSGRKDRRQRSVQGLRGTR